MYQKGRTSCVKNAETRSPDRRALAGSTNRNTAGEHCSFPHPAIYPTEQIRKGIQKRSFRNDVFATLEKAVDRLCDTICSLSDTVIASTTGRNRIIELFNREIV